MIEEHECRRIGGFQKVCRDFEGFFQDPLVLDGVYREEGEGVVFHAVSAPTDKEITAVLGQIVTQTMELLTRAGYVTEEEGRATVASDKDDGVLAPLQAASITYRIAYGPRQGQKLLTLQRQSAPSAAEKKRCVSLHGFSLHANVRCAANARQPLERLCRYITRPALSNERLAINSAGQVVLELKTPYRGGTPHLLFSPLEFLLGDGTMSRFVGGAAWSGNLVPWVS